MGKKAKKKDLDLSEQFYEDAAEQDKKPKKQADLDEIVRLAEEAEKIENELATIKEEEKRLKKSKDWIIKYELPRIMTELRIPHFGTEDGLEIEIQTGVAGSISNKNHEEAMKWLRDNGYEGIIKDTVTIYFEKGQDDIKNRLVKALNRDQLKYEQKESVHPQTLKAFLKECRENAIPIPEDTFSLYDYQIAKIKR